MSYPLYRKTSSLMPFRVRSGRKFLRGLLLGLVLLFAINGSAIAVVRDTEVENALRVYMEPLLKASNLEGTRLDIIIIADSTINAAVLPGGRIVVHTGLLLEAEDPTEVAGVLAHELGHYVNNDVLKLMGNFGEAEKTSLAGVALGLGLALVSGSAEPALAGVFLGGHLGQRNQLQFSRSMESGADRRAVDLLHRSGLGLSGMVALNKRMLELSPDPKFADAQYMITHPLTQNRLNFFSQQLSCLGPRPIPLGWQDVHDRVRAKLFGFTLNPDDVLQRYPASNTALSALMARSIALMRLARYSESIAIMAGVLNDYPDDGFLYDLMGDIQRQAGHSDAALEYYSEAIARLPWAALIRLQRAELWLKKKTATHALTARDDLLQAVRFEPDVPVYWHSLARAYTLLDQKGDADLSLAEASMLQHLYPIARSYAKRAQLEFPINGASWLRADDIIQEAEVQQKRKK